MQGNETRVHIISLLTDIENIAQNGTVGKDDRGNQFQDIQTNPLS